MRFSRPASSRFRRHWPLAPGTIFLNHGSFGACPKPVLEKQAELRRAMEAEPVQFLWRNYEKLLQPARAAVARFVHARPCDLVFVSNATTGINAVVRSLRFKPGDEILTTSHDYNACHNVLVEVARRARARLVVAEIPFPTPNAEVAVAAILAAATRRTRLAMIDHVTSSTALALPLARIVMELEQRHIDTLVDGAHAPGSVPLNLGRLAPAYYTANLHKWVCAPKGAAFLWVREDKQAGIQPAVISHGNNTPRRGFTPFQDRFDWAGTGDPTAWFAAAEAIRWLGSLYPGGWPALRNANHQLAIAGRRLLCDRFGVEPPCPESLLGSMAAIPLPNRFQHGSRSSKIDREQLELYDRFGVEVPFFWIGRPPRRYLRISAQLYNSLVEYEYLADAMERLSSGSNRRISGSGLRGALSQRKPGSINPTTRAAF